jgi:hypothetical protein
VLVLSLCFRDLMLWRRPLLGFILILIDNYYKTKGKKSKMDCEMLRPKAKQVRLFVENTACICVHTTHHPLKNIYLSIKAIIQRSSLGFFVLGGSRLLL